MKTLILDVNHDSCRYASQLIHAGEIVAFPTETVYGLGANALNENAVKKIFIAKNRPQDNPLIVHVAKKSQIYEFAEVSPLASMFIDHFLPGSLTVVLPKKHIIPDIVTANFKTVAVRIPSSNEARLFLEEVNCPICAPSANTSTRPSPTRAIDVYEDLNGKIPLILKGMDCSVGIESTVVDLTTDTPTILRPGIITKNEMENSIGVEVFSYSEQAKIVNSPGVRYKHYAPSVPLYLNTEGNMNVIDNKLKQLSNLYQKIVVLSDAIVDKSIINTNNVEFISISNDAKIVAEHIFSYLRDYEKKYSAIVVIYTNKTEVGYSVLNRLIKSSGGNLF